MATAEECRAALDSLIGRIAGLDAERRSAYLADRTLSCRVPDLGVTFVTRIAPTAPSPSPRPPTAPRPPRCGSPPRAMTWWR